MLHNYFIGAAGKNDTVTAIFAIPSACPRCEATFASSIKLARSIRSQERFILAAVYEDEDAARSYMEKLHLDADTIVVDRVNAFDQIFSTTMGGLQGAFIARIDVRNGRMITGGELSYVSPAFFKDFFSVQTPLPYFVYDENVVEYNQMGKTKEERKIVDNSLLYSVHELRLDSLFPSQIRNHPIERNNELIFLDEMCGGGVDMVREGEGSYRLKCLQQVDRAKRDTFIVLSQQDYEDCKNDFRYMPLDIIFQPDGGLAMSYSLPNVSKEYINNENVIAFRNAPTFLHQTKDGKNWQPLTCASNYNLQEWFLQHYRIFPIRQGYIVLACHKHVWPVVEDVISNV